MEHSTAKQSRLGVLISPSLGFLAHKMRSSCPTEERSTSSGGRRGGGWRRGWGAGRAGSRGWRRGMGWGVGGGGWWWGGGLGIGGGEWGLGGVREAFLQTGFSTRHQRVVLRETLRGGSRETEESGEETLEDNAEGRVGRKLCSLYPPSLRKGQRSNRVGRGRHFTLGPGAGM